MHQGAGVFWVLEHREIVAGFRLEPERHIGVVFGHHFVQEVLGLPGHALAPCACVSAALVGLLGVAAEPQLSDDAVEGLPHVVLHGRRHLDKLAVKHSSTRTALWEHSTEPSQRTAHTPGSKEHI